MSGELRVLRGGDERALVAFLEQPLETSLFLLSNAERAGLEDRGETFQATYVAHFAGGAITALAAHSWNGILQLQGDEGLEAAAGRASELSGRAVKGLIGSLPAVGRVRTALGLDAAQVARDAPDYLFALNLERLTVPALLSEPNVEFRAPSTEEVDETLAAWRAEYHVELLGAVRTPELEEGARRELNALRRRGDAWVLVRDGVLVAFTAFTARTRGFVQVGGVFTPPELRNRGYARAAVAASLLRARDEGATRSTLFTAQDNHAAIRAYRALGYELIQEWRLVFFR